MLFVTDMGIDRKTLRLLMINFSISFLLLCLATQFFHYAESASLKFEPRLSAPSSDEKILACYYRKGTINDTLVPSDVCTHILFAFAHMTKDGIVPNNPEDVASYRALMKLKDKNPKLRIIISLSSGFTSVVNFGTEARLRFSLGAVTFLQKYNFDGVDMDWEFPDLLEKEAFSEFLMILGSVLHWSNKTLSLAMPNYYDAFSHGYFVDTLNKYVDFLTVMTYDFHSYTKKSNMTDYNSPLFSPKGDNPFASTAGAVNFYLFSGVLPSKILIGFPTYARTWELANASIHGVHAPATGLGAPGPVTNSTGYYFLQDICTVQKKGGKEVRDEQDGAEYMYYGKTWVAFNGMYSAILKTDWLKKNNLAGVGVWSFEIDDPHNMCGFGSFPRLRKIRSNL